MGVQGPVERTVGVERRGVQEELLLGAGLRLEAAEGREGAGGCGFDTVSATRAGGVEWMQASCPS